MENDIKPKIQLNAKAKMQLPAKVKVRMTATASLNAPQPSQKLASPALDVDKATLNIDKIALKTATNILNGKWTMLIIHQLLSGTKRYSQLQQGVGGISPKLLATRLAMLQKHKLVAKKIYATIPPKTEYKLTNLGQQLEPIITAMAEFGAKFEAEL